MYFVARPLHMCSPGGGLQLQSNESEGLAIVNMEHSDQLQLVHARHYHSQMQHVQHTYVPAPWPWAWAHADAQAAAAHAASLSNAPTLEMNTGLGPTISSSTLSRPQPRSRPAASNGSRQSAAGTVDCSVDDSAIDAGGGVNGGSFLAVKRERSRSWADYEEDTDSRSSTPEWKGCSAPPEGYPRPIDLRSRAEDRLGVRSRRQDQLAPTFVVLHRLSASQAAPFVEVPYEPSPDSPGVGGVPSGPGIRYTLLTTRQYKLRLGDMRPEWLSAWSGATLRVSLVYKDDGAPVLYAVRPDKPAKYGQTCAKRNLKRGRCERGNPERADSTAADSVDRDLNEQSPEQSSSPAQDDESPVDVASSASSSGPPAGDPDPVTDSGRRADSKRAHGGAGGGKSKVREDGGPLLRFESEVVPGRVYDFRNARQCREVILTLDESGESRESFGFMASTFRHERRPFVLKVEHASSNSGPISGAPDGRQLQSSGSNPRPRIAGHIEITTRAHKGVGHAHSYVGSGAAAGAAAVVGAGARSEFGIGSGPSGSIPPFVPMLVDIPVSPLSTSASPAAADLPAAAARSATSVATHAPDHASRSGCSSKRRRRDESACELQLQPAADSPESLKTIAALHDHEDDPDQRLAAQSAHVHVSAPASEADFIKLELAYPGRRPAADTEAFSCVRQDHRGVDNGAFATCYLHGHGFPLMGDVSHMHNSCGLGPVPIQNLLCSSLLQTSTPAGAPASAGASLDEPHGHTAAASFDAGSLVQGHGMHMGMLRFLPPCSGRGAGAGSGAGRARPGPVGPLRILPMVIPFDSLATASEWHLE